MAEDSSIHPCMNICIGTFECAFQLNKTGVYRCSEPVNACQYVRYDDAVMHSISIVRQCVAD